MDEEDNLAPTDQGDGNRPNIYISEETLLSIALTSEQLEALIPENIKNVVIVSPEDLKNLEDIVPESLMDHVDVELSEDSARFNGAVAQKIDTDGDGIEDLGYVVVKSISYSKERIFDDWAYGKQREALFLNELPGTDAQWRAAIALHEIGHLQGESVDAFSSSGILRAESSADRIMVEELKIISPDVAEAIMAARAIGSFNDMISHFIIESDHLSNPLVLSSLNDKIPPVELNSEGVKIFSKFFEELHEAKDKLKEAIGKNLADEGFEYTEDELIRLGRDALINDKPLLFQTMADLYEKGAFADSPIQEQYVWEFLEAARTYVPENFDVADPDKAFDPPKYYSELKVGDLKAPFIKLDTLDKN